MTREADYYALIQRYFPRDQWQNAYLVMMGESGGNPDAANDQSPERERSFGLFQINTNVHPLTPEEARDPETNVRYAAALYAAQGWRPWTVARQMGLVDNQGGGNMPSPDDALWQGAGYSPAATSSGPGAGTTSTTPAPSRTGYGPYTEDLTDTGQAPLPGPGDTPGYEGQLQAALARLYQLQQESQSLDPNDKKAFIRLLQIQTEIANLDKQIDDLRVILGLPGRTDSKQADRDWQDARRAEDWKRDDARYAQQRADALAKERQGANQANLRLALEAESARIANAIRQGEFDFRKGQEAFQQALANQQAMMAASKWAVPEGMEHFPGFEPGGNMAVASKLLGGKFSPIGVQRMRYQPIQPTVSAPGQGASVAAGAGGGSAAAGAGAGAAGGGTPPLGYNPALSDPNFDRTSSLSLPGPGPGPGLGLGYNPALSDPNFDRTSPLTPPAMSPYDMSMDYQAPPPPASPITPALGASYAPGAGEMPLMPFPNIGYATEEQFDFGRPLYTAGAVDPYMNRRWRLPGP